MYQGNININNNTGNTITAGNLNCAFHGCNNNIFSLSCKNTNFMGSSNNLNLSSEMNLKFQGDNNSVTLKNNMNLQFIGNSNQAELNSNSNTKIYGNQNVMKLNSNTNAIIQGDGNMVNASNNTNLTVEGNNHKVTSVVETLNHHLKISLEGYCSKNRIEAKKVGAGGTMTNVSNPGNSNYTFSSNYVTNGATDIVTPYGGIGDQANVQITEYKSWSFLIHYVQEISINRASYRMGIFDFNMNPVDNGAAIEATFDHSKYDQAVLHTFVDSSGKAFFLATKAGKEETLEIVGPGISINETNGMTTVRIS